MMDNGPEPTDILGETMHETVSRRVGLVHAESVNDRAKLIMHRLIARKLACDPDALTRVRAQIDGIEDDTPGHVSEWRDILQGDVQTVRRRLTERSCEMTRLRLSSPFVGVLPLTDPHLRRRIYQKAKLGLHRAT